MARLYAGTSGFSYPEWKGSFYPPDLPGEEMLSFYARAFPTVEINNTFYRYPKELTLTQWVEAVPSKFRFSIKAHRRITHEKRLRDVDTDLTFFFERMRGLGDRLGPVLFQLPPSLRCDLAVLETFLAQIRPGVTIALEFRHPSWYQDATYHLLQTYRAALCLAETDDSAASQEVIGPIAYLRLHKSRYPVEALSHWAGWISERLAEGHPVYAYFTHEEGAPAPEYARALTDLLSKS